MALNIRRALQARGMSIPQLAERMGVSHQNLYGLIAYGNPTYSSLQKISDALGCGVIDLFDEPQKSSLPRLDKSRDTISVGSPLALSIKRAIKSRGKKLVDVANLIGKKSLSGIINGSPHLSTLESIASVLDCDVAELLPSSPINDFMEDRRKTVNLERKRQRQSARIEKNHFAQVYALKHA